MRRPVELGPRRVPILAKALYQGAAARLSELGELAAEASLATSEEMQRLGARGALPAEAMTLLADLPPATGAHDVNDVTRLAASTARILAVLGSPAGIAGDDRMGAV